MRLFLAIRLHETGQRALREQCETILRGKGLRPTDSALYHVTLHFFGETSETETALLNQALQRVEERPFDFALDGFGSFGKNTLYAKIGSGSEDFQRVRKSVESVFGLKPERFTPHVKIARNNKLHWKELEKTLEALNAQKKMIPCHAARLDLIDSVETVHGRAYETIAFQRFS